MSGEPITDAIILDGTGDRPQRVPAGSGWLTVVLILAVIQFLTSDWFIAHLLVALRMLALILVIGAGAAYVAAINLTDLSRYKGDQ